MWIFARIEAEGLKILISRSKSVSVRAGRQVYWEKLTIHRSYLSVSHSRRLDFKNDSRERGLVHACSVFCSQKGSASYNGLAHWLDQRLEPVARGRSEADRFSSGNSCWSCSQIRLTRPVSRGRARTGNSSLPIRTRSRAVGVSARASLTWITTSCHARWGNCINGYVIAHTHQIVLFIPFSLFFFHIS